MPKHVRWNGGIAVSSNGTNEGGSGLFAFPSSGLGRVCVGLLVASVVAVVLNSALLMPFTESRVGLETAQWVANLAIGVCLLAAGATGLWAVIRLRERSWLLFLAIGLTLVALVLNIAD
jgi:hypothetical protein